MRISEISSSQIDNPIPTSDQYNQDRGNLNWLIQQVEDQLEDSGDSGDSDDSDEFTSILDTPTLVKQHKLQSTQSWLDTVQGGGVDPVFELLDDRPVVIEYQGIMYILDGHHRIASAFQQGKKISVYLFHA